MTTPGCKWRWAPEGSIVDGWAVLCPGDMTVWGFTYPLADKHSGQNARPLLAPIFRHPDIDGVPVYGPRKNTARGYARRERQTYADAAKWPSGEWNALRVVQPVFETWCHVCGRRFRVDVAARPGYAIG